MARRDETPRDLLFGLLALHNGLIDQDQLVAAFGAWSRAQGKTLAEILVERGSIDRESGKLLAAMAENQLKLHGGDAEKSLASIGARPSTREKLEAIGDGDLTGSLPLVETRDEGDDPYRTASLVIGTSTSDGHRFRVLRPHAKGGLGAVFVAMDGELNREVALKQILDRHADDPGSRTRFLIEAEITGGLEHPGIVPVYGLGHYGDGRPYYAMRFIRGDSLKEAVAAFHADESLRRDPGRRSLGLRKLLRRFVDVCNAIDYAHGRGVLHRDLKPGNVIVGKHGETLVVDWGLAKAMGRHETGDPSDEQTLRPSSSSGSAETLPGSAIGTPAYMSPEQARGDLEHLGPRSDVYSLGATLYSLLTGRAPFEGTDIGTVLRDVQKGSFPPPHRVDPSIDRALEAVCLKAMAQRPESRHATARALADDVERWAADEPTSAWREPVSIRARRWMRRNRTAVAAAAVALLATLLGTAAVLAVQTRANANLTRANDALAIANQQVTKANAHLTVANVSLAAAKDREAARFALASDAIRLFHGVVGDDLVLKADQFKPLRNKLLQGAADFYVKLEKLLEGQTDPASRRSLGQSYFDLGKLTQEIGDQSKSLEAHRKGLAVREDLADHEGADADAQGDLAFSLLAIGSLLADTGRKPEALPCLERALAILQGLDSSGRAGNDHRELLGLTLIRLGAFLYDTGNTAGANSAFERSLATFRRLSDANPGVALYRYRVSSSHINLGNNQIAQGRMAEAVESYRQAVEIQESVVREDPEAALYRAALARSHNNLGMIYGWQGETARELGSLRRALDIREELARANPAVTLYQADLARTYNDIGTRQYVRRDTAEALESFRRSFAIWTRLAADHPETTFFQSSLADCFLRSGYHKMTTGRLAEAIEDFTREAKIRETLAAANSTVLEYRGALANCLVNTAALLHRDGQTSRARDLSARGVTILELLVRELPEVPLYRFRLAEGCLRSGQAREAQGDLRGSVGDWKRAVDLYRAIPGLDNEATFYHGCTHASLSGLAGKPGAGLPAEEREAEAAEALGLLRRAVGMGWRDPIIYRSEPALDPLRARPDFRLLMMDLGFPDRPFKE